MDGLILHPATKQALERFVAKPSHAVALVGLEGIGKLTLAYELAAKLLNISRGKLEIYPYLLVLRPEDKKSLGIDDVRKLEHFVALKIAAKKGISRVIIIENAHLLTTEAQNAMLKPIEEPPADTVIILTTRTAQSLLPTITSRVQLIQVTAPASAELENYFAGQGHDKTAIARASQISAGLPGLMHAMLEPAQEHPLLAATELVRDLLRQSTFERLLQVDTLAKQPETFQHVLTVLQRMAEVALQKPATAPTASKWQGVLTAAYDANEALAKGATPRLVATNLMLNL